MDSVFHYPPELLNLLIDALPLLFRRKKDLLLFFRGAGVAPSLLQDLTDRVESDPGGVTKYEIARTVLTRLNEKGDAALRERREILKRVAEFEDFSTCWPEDQLKARGLVAQIRKVIEVKDAFTRMRLEREREAERRRAEQQARFEAEAKRRSELAAVRADLFSLFGLQDPQRRGRELEKVLARLFEASGILVRETFARRGPQGEGVVEQIDGVVDIDGRICLVELKWCNQPLGTSEVSPHLVRLFSRGGRAMGLLISYSGYTEPAIAICRDALQHGVVVILCTLREIVHLLEREGDLKALLNAKTKSAIIDKQPFQEIVDGIAW